MLGGSVQFVHACTGAQSAIMALFIINNYSNIASIFNKKYCR